MNKIIYDNKEVTPSKVVCVGRNYVEHIKELGNEMPEDMVLFCKPNSSISSELRYVGEDGHYEAEISFLIMGGDIKGVGFGLDLTKRDLQSKLKGKGLPWERAKAFDGAAVFSEFVHIEKSDIDSLEVELLINGKVAQKGGVELMIYKPKEIIKEIKSFMSLEDGDIVMSGTPKGVGKFKRGDSFVGKIKKNSLEIIKKEWIVI